MKKLYYNFIKDLKVNIICLVSSLLLGIIIFLIFYFLNGPQSIVGAANASLIAMAFLAILFFFPLLSYFGTFDFMSFGFYSFGWMFVPKGNRKYKDLYSYSTAKREKRKNAPKTFIPFGISFTLFLLVSIVLEIVYFTISNWFT